MDRLKKAFFANTVNVFEFLEKDFGYRRIPEFIEYEKEFGDSHSAVRYIGSVVAIDVVWYHTNAAMDVTFTELANGNFPRERYFWGNSSGKSRAISLFTLVVMNQGSSKDFLLGDMTQLGFAKVKKRDELIITNMVFVLQNLGNLSLEFASKVTKGDLSVFPAVMRYQQGLIEKTFPNT
jgi:hypothetical protein